MVKFNYLKLTAVFLIVFVFLAYLYAYFLKAVLVNPYQTALLTVFVFYISFLSLVPTLMVYFVKNKMVEGYLPLFLGGTLGIILIYVIEFILPSSKPIMKLYIGLHDYLFNLYYINIYFLDYSGFGLIAVGLSAAFFALVMLGIFSIYFKLRRRYK